MRKCLHVCTSAVEGRCKTLRPQRNPCVSRPLPSSSALFACWQTLALPQASCGRKLPAVADHASLPHRSAPLAAVLPAPAHKKNQDIKNMTTSKNMNMTAVDVEAPPCRVRRIKRRSDEAGDGHGAEDRVDQLALTGEAADVAEAHRGPRAHDDVEAATDLEVPVFWYQLLQQLPHHPCFALRVASSRQSDRMCVVYLSRISWTPAHGPLSHPRTAGTQTPYCPWLVRVLAPHFFWFLRSHAS